MFYKTVLLLSTRLLWLKSFEINFKTVDVNLIEILFIIFIDTFIKFFGMKKTHWSI